MNTTPPSSTCSYQPAPNLDTGLSHKLHCASPSPPLPSASKLVSGIRLQTFLAHLPIALIAGHDAAQAISAAAAAVVVVSDSTSLGAPRPSFPPMTVGFLTQADQCLLRAIERNMDTLALKTA